ncbi:inositol monophosphatase family protein [Pontibacillus salipaludis]|uniref:inositol-phosphate phosphatase n=1 Tax=Pontibacillus salipaludis TaxID=1697394 RepID=A0ABQ1QA67_9BACI|nr:inositol monophosphatase family protein [Pontibacillus salipaludis]GGD19475.1 inositol-1-monophosphatase [Pontibacillus salipaludis]
MNDQQKQLIFEQAKQWILEAGERIRAKMHEPFVIETKSTPDDLVTEIDQNTEQFFAKKIRETYPDHRVLGEEGFGDELADLNGTVWIVDPIDGTMNFVHQKQNFAISVGIYSDGIGEIGFIYDVMGDVLYQSKRGEGAYKNDQKLSPLSSDVVLERSIVGLNAFWATENPRVDKNGMQELIRKVRGTRSYGSAALEFAYVVEGNMDAYVTMRLAPWDVAAGIVLLNEVGGITTKADGTEVNMLTTNSIIASNPAIHREIIDKHIELKK